MHVVPNLSQALSHNRAVRSIRVAGQQLELRKSSRLIFKLELSELKKNNYANFYACICICILREARAPFT